MYQYEDYRNMPFANMMGMPQQYYPMIYMPDQQVEMMYPKVYHMINNAVGHYCDMMEMKYGPMYMPSKEEMNSMVDNIYNEMSPNVEEMEEYKDSSKKERQFGFGGKRLFKDLVLIFLIREILRRRKEHGNMYGGFQY